jgi:hypothetical protein
MVDIGDLGGGLGKAKPFPPFEKSAVERLAEAAKSRFADLDFGMNAADRAVRKQRLNPLEQAAGGGRSASLVAKEMEKAHRSIADALGGSLGGYYKSRDHMRDVFGTASLASEVAKMVNGPSAGTEADKYLASLAGSFNHDSVMRDLPPMHVQPNPIHETNEHLAGLGKKIDALVDLQAKQAEVIDKLLQAQITNEAAQERTDRRAYRLGVISVILASILSIGAIVVTIAG